MFDLNKHIRQFSILRYSTLATINLSNKIRQHKNGAVIDLDLTSPKIYLKNEKITHGLVCHAKIL